MTFSTRNLIDNASLTRLQYLTILICFLMNMLDGMDVMIISYASTAIIKDWQISPAAMGLVFSAGLLGMTFGALFLTPIADQAGRKTLIIISALLMGSTIYATSWVNSIPKLIMLRFLSGVGIGCMLASTAALMAEYAPTRLKDFLVSTVIGGYPVGAVLSGLAASQIIPTLGWQTMFQLAGMITLASVPLIVFFLSESLDFYIKRRPANALAKVNRILARMNFGAIDQLPPAPPKQHKIAVKGLMGKEFLVPTIQLWIALFLAFATLYFLTSWIPSLAQSTGLSTKLAIYAGIVFNAGAFFGIITQGYFSNKYGLKKTIGIFLILTGVLMAVFKVFLGSDMVFWVFCALGFGIQGGFVGLYAVAALMYPTEFRTTGVGASIGIGRLGGIVGPAIGGVLIGMGFSISTNFLIYAIPTILAGVMTMFISSKEIS